ncbi:MAG: 3-oxoacid CoA-transferase subunit A [Elusimicrobia bacterium]|nr:3-oxoacid CoA-transferase subunit A [Elusimicrobiota bacterium]
MKPVITTQEAAKKIKDGASIMVGGFMCCGQPLSLLDAILEACTKNLTVITNDAGFPDKGIGKLIVAGRVSKLIASHIGLNPVAGQKMNSGEMKVELVPQGTLAERIRSAGAGLGGVLTPTGIGTKVEECKQKVMIDDQEFLLELPLKADFALLKATTCDRQGNCFLAKSEKNFNTVMAMAADEVIAEAENVVEIGQLDQDRVTIPGVFVQTIAEARK